MDKVSRLGRMQRLLTNHRVVSSATLAAELGCSVVTAKRLIQYARDRLGMPIGWDREARGYRLEADGSDPGAALPGLWFGAPELSGIVTLHACLRSLAPTPLGPLLAPLGKRLATVVARSGLSFREVQRRVRILPQPGRPARPDWEALTQALIQRRRIAFTYDGRSRAETTERTVSPQRLVLYRGSWYLDAWCHLREALRSFAVERIRAPHVLAVRAKDVPENTLDEVLASAYGIFSGAPTALARLRFSPFAARWVRDETWHPRQVTTEYADGSLEIAFPIGRREELILDVLRWGPDVEVLAPADLRQEVGARLAAAAARYGVAPTGSGSDPPPS